jgi:hypothetical protein
MTQAMTLASAKAEAGSVSIKVGKMPGTSWSIPATRCQTGRKLAEVEGSVCSKCYAMKGNALYPSVKAGWEANYMKATALIAANPGKWAAAMAFQIRNGLRKQGVSEHRWFASGDLQSVEMLAAIVLVCGLTPDVRHWLPTREASIVDAWYKQGGQLPSNLVIRVSSTMVGDAPRARWENTSTVHRKGDIVHGFECGAYTRQGKCGPCRACWDPTVENVSYPLH